MQFEPAVDELGTHCEEARETPAIGIAVCLHAAKDIGSMVGLVTDRGGKLRPFLPHRESKIGAICKQVIDRIDIERIGLGGVASGRKQGGHAFRRHRIK